MYALSQYSSHLYDVSAESAEGIIGAEGAAAASLSSSYLCEFFF